MPVNNLKTPVSWFTGIMFCLLCVYVQTFNCVMLYDYKITHTHKHEYTHTHTHTHIHIQTHSHINIYIYIYRERECIYIYIYIYIYSIILYVSSNIIKWYFICRDIRYCSSSGSSDDNQDYYNGVIV